MTGIVLDTNVVSEPVKRSPNTNVLTWFAERNTAELYLTTTVLCELTAGAERMPLGRKRTELTGWIEGLIRTDFTDRILPLTIEAVWVYGELVARAYANGRPPDTGDAQIAAVAKANNMAVATRNTSDFEAFDIQVIDPWAG